MLFKNFLIFSYLFSLFATIFNLSIVYKSSVSLSKIDFNAIYFSSELIVLSFLMFETSLMRQFSNSSNKILKSSRVFG